MTAVHDLDLKLPWDVDSPPVPPSPAFRPLEEYIDFLEEIDAFRSPPRETTVFEGPFSL
jgi:hypothetical protein